MTEHGQELVCEFAVGIRPSKNHATSNKLKIVTMCESTLKKASKKTAMITRGRIGP